MEVNKGPKRRSVEADDLNSPKKQKGETVLNTEDYVTLLAKHRSMAAPSVMLFNFNKKRVKILSEVVEVPKISKGILYWMSRDVRIQDNWAMLFAQKLAFKNQVSLHVCFSIKMEYAYFGFRCNKFLVQGLEEVQKGCIALNIKFHLMNKFPAEGISEFVKSNNIGAVVCDFNPLRHHKEQVNELKSKLDTTIPLCQVDAHNIVPCWTASDKKEYSAKLIRPKIMNKLDEFLTDFPPVIRHPYINKMECPIIDWQAIISQFENIKAKESNLLVKPGYKAGICMLQEFCENRLDSYESKRNDPMGDSTSRLSPWLRSGHISAQRCILAVKGKKDNSNVKCFIEEAVVRRELTDNFCYYNDYYDTIEGASDWAKTTLNEHRRDKRLYLYNREEFENALTHDELWNSAQLQLINEGGIHGYLRMYWAKKILEWSSSPEEALDISLYLNNYYGLDGCDPNGYVGCMWSIAGVHDQPWMERPVFGKIRFMNYAGCKRKFDIASYVEKFGGIIHESKKNNKETPKASIKKYKKPQKQEQQNKENVENIEKKELVTRRSTRSKTKSA